MKPSPKRIAAALPLLALSFIAAGSTALWGWPMALLIVGGLVWVDLFFAGREQARKNALRTIPE